MIPLNVREGDSAWQNRQTAREKMIVDELTKSMPTSSYSFEAVGRCGVCCSEIYNHL